MEGYLSRISEGPLGGYGIFFSNDNLPDPGHAPQENPDVFHKFFPGGMKRISSIKAEDDIEFEPSYKDTVHEEKIDYLQGIIYLLTEPDGKEYPFPEVMTDILMDERNWARA
jgi:hypothetical protein